jgi:hypothetical protein
LSSSCCVDGFAGFEVAVKVAVRGESGRAKTDIFHVLVRNSQEGVWFFGVRAGGVDRGIPVIAQKIVELGLVKFQVHVVGQ